VEGRAAVKTPLEPVVVPSLPSLKGAADSGSAAPFSFGTA
jgi:hypothetical protein